MTPSVTHSGDTRSAGKGTPLRPLVFAFLGVLALWSLSLALTLILFGTWATRSAFGEMFGAVNTLFSGLAFAAFVYTVVLQREELALQRRELELTREELARSAAAQERSEGTLFSQLKVMDVTAQLSALNSLIEHYRVKINSTDVASEKEAARRQQLRYIDKLEGALNALLEVDA